MRFNFQKISAVIASVVMVGSSLGVAAAANYPAPFVAGGSADVAIVYGTGAGVSILDAIQAGNIQSNLQSKMSTGSTGSNVGTSGGDSAKLATSSQQLYMNGTLNVARSVLTKDTLPTLLADGSTFDNSGTEYKYTQTIAPTNKQILFTKSGESKDPELAVDTGYQASAPFLNYTITFAKTLNVSDSSVVGTSTIKMLDQEYTVGANSDFNTLYLYGSGVSQSLNEGETKTVTVGSVDHTVTLTGTSSATTGTLEVDGVRKSVTKGSSYRFAGDFEVYIKDVFYTTREASTPSMDLLLGAQTLHFESGQAVRYGADDTTMLGTLTTISGTAGLGINSITIAQAGESATGDYVKIGGTYTDRVLKGFQVQFADVVPALDSDARDSIVIDTDNSVSAKVKFTSYLAGTAGEKILTYAKDADLMADATLTGINLVNDANKTIHVLEGERAILGDWIVVNDNDEGRILEVISIGTGSSNDKTTFKDVMTGDDIDVQTGARNATMSGNPVSIGTGQYYVSNNVTDGDNALWTTQVTWGAGASANNTGVNPGSFVGTQTTLFPRVKLKNGEWMSFLKSTTVTNGTTYSLPGLYLYSDYKTGQAWTWSENSTAVGSANRSITFGSVNYTIALAGTTNLTATLSSVALVPNKDSSAKCTFTTTTGPALLIQEEKTLASSNGQSICIPLTSVGTSPAMPAIGTPVFSDGVGSFSSTTLQSNTYKSQAVDLYGTLVEKDVSTGTNYAVTLAVPDEQMYADVLVTANGVTVTPGSAGSTGSVAELGEVLVKDTEVSSVSSKNLIIVGGSCINSAAAKVLGGAYCGSAFTEKTSASSGQFLIQSVKDVYTTGKIALLVAGYNADDTVNAAKYLTTKTVDTTAGKKYVGTSATSAELVVSS